MWTYLQTGKLITPDGLPAAHEWYSGHLEHANKPEDEGILGEGPIPRGRYTMSGLLRDTHMGPVAIHLMPDAPTAAYIKSLGRCPYSFYAHDDTALHNHGASEGCIVSVAGTAAVMSLWNSPDHELVVQSGVDPS